MAGEAFLGLPTLSNQPLGADILSERQVQAHIDRIRETLFPHRLDVETTVAKA